MAAVAYYTQQHVFQISREGIMACQRVPAALLGALLAATQALLFGVASASTAADPPESKSNWSYAGETGPAHWAELDAEYTVCGSGQRQSPIDLKGATTKAIANIDFHYSKVPLSLSNNGHRVQVPVPPGSHMTLDGQRYDLQQLYFHTPSEHRVDGKLSDGELHLVHKHADGSLAVVGVLLETGSANPALAPIISAAPEKNSGPVNTGKHIDVNALLPRQRTSYRYVGSLTTPPCTEGVKWTVMSEPIELSSAQLDRLTTATGKNNRPVQPRNGRPLLKDSTP